MKNFILLIAKVFPWNHPLKGKPTEFRHKILSGEKIHTLRRNFDYWKKRIDQVQSGQAMLCLKQWIERPYYPPGQEDIFYFQGEPVGIQKVIKHPKYGWAVEVYPDQYVIINALELARNDGLEYVSFEAWFKDYDLEKDGPLACIHFTGFRYLEPILRHLNDLSLIKYPADIITFTYKHEKHNGKL